jgi:hypothetical protein
MKRFSFGEDEPEDEEELDDMQFFMPSSEFISMGQFADPNQEILNLSIKICEKSIFWRFYSSQKKVQIIGDVFKQLKKITEGNSDAIL